MNIKSFLITIVVTFITVFATDALIHQVLLGSTYAETKQLWRPEAELMAMFPYMVAGQFLMSTAFASLFALFVAPKRCWKSTLTFGFLLGALNVGGQIIMFAVQPIPGSLLVKWCLAYVVQSLVLGVVMHLVYRPTSLPVPPPKP